MLKRKVLGRATCSPLPMPEYRFANGTRDRHEAGLTVDRLRQPLLSPIAAPCATRCAQGVRRDRDQRDRRPGHAGASQCMRRSLPVGRPAALPGASCDGIPHIRCWQTVWLQRSWCRRPSRRGRHASAGTRRPRRRRCRIDLRISARRRGEASLIRPAAVDVRSERGTQPHLARK